MSTFAEHPMATFDESHPDDTVSVLVEPVQLEALPQEMAELDVSSFAEAVPGLGTRWRDIDPEDMPGIWQDLRNWVDWLVVEYDISKQQIPPCWYRHRKVVAELYAMRCAEWKVWESNEPQTNAAFQFHPHLASMIQRLSNLVGKCINSKKHVEDQSYGDLPSGVLTYDEDDWSQFLTSQTQTQVLPRESTDLWWRRRLEMKDKDGTITTHVSEPLKVSAKKESPVQELRPTQLLSATNHYVQVASTSQGGQLHESVWECSPNPESTDWKELEISKEDQSLADDSHELGPED